MKKNKKIRVAVTCGDAAGISYEVVFKALARLLKEKIPARFLVIGDWPVARWTLQNCGLNLKPRLIKDIKKSATKQGTIDFIDMGLVKTFSPEEAGHPQFLFGKASLKYIEKAYELIKEGKADCLVTSPVNKKAVCLYKKNFTGHTEFLAGISGTKKIAMMIGGDRIKVTLVTRHIPLNMVTCKLNAHEILSAARLTNEHLIKFCRIENPKIALCALNPHAGEEGVLGGEENEIIIPAAERARAEKINLIGPLPADSVFEKAYRKKFDAVICLYHDQGLIPLKMIEREKAVNITLGLPFIRTSPAHGTAYDIACKNKADSSSFYFAVKKAVEMAK
ncbi:MAG: 4-hydroxythreonine-4-phosphate dehydrogenase PdxA [Candidatus Omnitrophota bacterium]